MTRSSLRCSKLNRMALVGAIAVSVAMGATNGLEAGESGGKGGDAEVLESVIPDLESALAVLDGRTIRYSWMLFHPRDGEAPAFDPPEDATSIDRLAKLVVVDVYRQRSAYRIREHTVWSKDSREIGRITDYTSDGNEFHTRYAGANDEIAHLTLDLNDRMHRVGPAMDAYGWRVLGQVAPLDFQFIIEAGAASETLQRIRRGDDGLEWFKWQVVPDAPQTGFTLGLDVDSRRVRRIRMDVHSMDLSLPAARVMLRKDVTFTDHLIDGELLRGARAVDQVGDAGEDYPPVWAVSIIAPLAVTITPLTSELVHLVARPSESVQDTRFDIAYRTGDVRLNLDGRIVRLGGPPRGDVGWDLDRWVGVELAPTIEPITPPQVATAPSSNVPGVFHAGSVLVEDPPVTVSHEFSLTNDSAETWRVAQVVKSCGCLRCEVDRDVILPGDSAIVSVSIMIASSGRHSHSATVVLEDGTFVTYRVAADGFTTGSLRAVSSGFVRDEGGWRADIRAYWVESEAGPTAGDWDSLPELALDGHTEATLAFDGWKLIEEADLALKRPRRLLGRGVVRIPNSDGQPGEELLATLRLTVPPGRIAEIPVLRLQGDRTR